MLGGMNEIKKWMQKRKGQTNIVFKQGQEWPQYLEREKKYEYIANETQKCQHGD